MQTKGQAGLFLCDWPAAAGALSQSLSLEWALATSPVLTGQLLPPTGTLILPLSISSLPLLLLFQFLPSLGVKILGLALCSSRKTLRKIFLQIHDACRRKSPLKTSLTKMSAFYPPGSRLLRQVMSTPRVRNISVTVQTQHHRNQDE